MKDDTSLASSFSARELLKFKKRKKKKKEERNKNEKG
jgi:hypothetical protein